MDGSDLAAAVEMLSQRSFIGTVVDILDKDTSLVTVIFRGVASFVACFVH